MSKLAALTTIFSHPLNRKKPLSTALKILFWKMNQLFFKFAILIQIVPGLFCICYPQSAYGTLVAQTLLPEFEEMTFLQEILQADDTFFDVGANMGSWSLVAAGKIKFGHIYAFEPGSIALQNLYQNIRLNQLENKITVIEKVVSNKSGYESFVLETIPDINHIAYGNLSGKKVIKYQSTTLDSFIENERISKIDVLKVDVEGAEHKVLEGLLKNIASHKIGILIVELNFHTSEFGFSPKETVKLMQDADYEIFVFDEKKHLVSLNEVNLKAKNILNVIAVSPEKKYQKRLKQYLVRESRRDIEA